MRPQLRDQFNNGCRVVGAVGIFLSRGHSFNCFPIGHVVNDHGSGANQNALAKLATLENDGSGTDVGTRTDPDAAADDGPWSDVNMTVDYTVVFDDGARIEQDIVPQCSAGLNQSTGE